jgi:hypothetical protein
MSKDKLMTIWIINDMRIVSLLQLAGYTVREVSQDSTNYWYETNAPIQENYVGRVVVGNIILYVHEYYRALLFDSSLVFSDEIDGVKRSSDVERIQIFKFEIELMLSRIEKNSHEECAYKNLKDLFYCERKINDIANEIFRIQRGNHNKIELRIYDYYRFRLEKMD